MMLDRMLVAADAARTWRALLPFVQGLAQRHAAEVVLCEAVPLEPGDGSRITAARDARRRLLDDAALLEAQGLRTRVVVRLGEPVAALSRVAVATEARLVALASRGRRGLARWLQRSVTVDALRTIDRPLLVANARQLARPVAPTLRRILLPLGDPESAAPVLPHVVEIAGPAGAEVVLMHAAPNFAPLGPELLPEYAAAIPALAEPPEWLEPLAQRLIDAGIAARVRPALTPVVSAICACAQEESADLVVLATHPPARWIDRLVGSVAERQLRHAPCPILVVPVSAAKGGAAA
jgi:nucleotide-binding universal stress UspA family protein